MKKGKGKKIVVIGGGTGTYTALMGLKKYPVDLSVVISMMDTGGSNRVLRDEFGLLPTSDIRQCMVALASNHSHEILRKLFTYRYSSGTGITGMTFGNLFMAALTDIYSSQKEAIQKTCEILDVQGKILPVTYDNVHLIARYEDGQQILGEHFIDEPPDGFGGKRIVELEVIPKATPNPDALSVIHNADLIVLGPGDLYTSTICNLVVGGIAAAIRHSKAKKVYVMNLMTRYSQTYNFAASDYLKELEKYLGIGAIDYVLLNKSYKFSRGILRRYKEEKAAPVKDDLGSSKNIKIIRRNFISNQVYIKPASDKLKRSLIRHDSTKLAKAVISLL
jgi:uncharacterized cofD-like protein